MKTTARSLTFAIVVATIAMLSFAPARAAEKEKKAGHHHHHDHAAMVGPNGGKVLHEVEPHAELFVTKDRKLQLTFLDAKGKATALKDQSISVTCGKLSAPTRMKFGKKGTSLFSDKALPAGMNIPTIVQIRMKPGVKSVIIRLTLNLEDCPSCKYLKYACICEHAHEDHKKDKKK